MPVGVDLIDSAGVIDIRTPNNLPEGAALSPSRASDFLTCPLLFRFRAIDRIPERPRPAAARGTLVHGVLERLYELPPSERTLVRAYDLLPSTWSALTEAEPDIAYAVSPADVEYVPGEPPALDSATTDKWLSLARPLLRTYFTLENPAQVRAKECETRLEAKLADGTPLRGVIDRIDVSANGEVRVVDYKTGRSPGVGFEQKAMFQMRFYAVLWQLARETIPSRLQLFYLGDGTCLRYDPTSADVSSFQRKLAAIWLAIVRSAESENWEPRPSKACSFCEHQASCPAKGGSLRQFSLR